MVSRSEIGVMTDLILQVHIDGCRHRLRVEWDAGRPGKLSDVYGLALGLTEYAIRVAGRMDDQLTLEPQVFAD